MIPERIGRYKILSEIGQGGMAIVYLAQDPHVDRKVAIKLLPRQVTIDDQLQKRFQREAKIIASLEHPAIVPVYDYGDFEGQPYLVMRYMPGGSLRDRIKHKALDLAETSRILGRVAEGLDKAHEKGIIHRDLKPDNILFDEDDRPYLADFGIARLAEASQTMTIIGTPTYMSPEQVHGDITLDHRCDIYAMGVIIFEMLAGRQPYLAQTPAKLMMKHILEPVPNILTVNQQLPSGVQEIIEHSMAKNPADRYASATAITADIAKLAALAPIQKQYSPNKTITESTSPTFPVPPPPARRLLPWAGAAGLVLLLALFIYFGVLKDRNQPAANPAAETAEIAAALVKPRTTPTITRSPRPTQTPAPTETPLLESGAQLVAAVDPDTPTATATTKPASTNTSTPMPQQMEVIVSSAYLRSGPGTVYSQVGLVSLGTIARIIAKNSDSSWLNVELQDGTTGWIATSVTDQEPASIVNIPIAATIPGRPAPTNTTAAGIAQPAATQSPTDGGATSGGSGGGGNGGNPQPTLPPPPTAANPEPTAANP